MDLAFLRRIEHPALDESVREALLARVAADVSHLRDAVGALIDLDTLAEPMRGRLLAPLFAAARGSEVWRQAFLVAAYSGSPAIRQQREAAGIPCRTGEFALVECFASGDAAGWLRGGSVKNLREWVAGDPWIRRALAAGAQRTRDATWRRLVEARCRAGEPLFPEEYAALRQLAAADPGDGRPLWPHLSSREAVALLRQLDDGSPAAAATAGLTGDGPMERRHLILKRQVHCGPEMPLAMAYAGLAIAISHRDHIRFARLDCEPARHTDAFHYGGFAMNLLACDRGRLLLLSEASDDQVRIWDPYGNAKLRSLRGHGALVIVAAAQPEGPLVLTGSQDETARVWDVRTGACLRILRGHGDNVVGAAWSPDGLRGATLDNGGRLASWSLPEGRLIAERRFEGFGLCSDLAWGPAGLVVGDGKTLRLLADDLSDRCTADLDERCDSVQAIGTSVLSYRSDGLQVRTADLKLLVSHPPGEKGIRSVVGLAGGRHALALDGDGSCRVLAMDGSWSRCLPGPYSQVASAPDRVEAALLRKDGVLEIHRPLVDLLLDHRPIRRGTADAELLAEALASGDPSDEERAWLKFCSLQSEVGSP